MYVSHPQLTNNTNSLIQENVDEMKTSQDEMKVTITELERNQYQIKVSRFAGTTKILDIFTCRKLDSAINQTTGTYLRYYSHVCQNI